MLKTDIIHPALLQALAEAGHGARILIGDANYPVTVKSNPLARQVYLNFIPGLIGGVDIVTALAGAVPIESAMYMSPPDGSMPEIVAEYQKIIGAGIPFEQRDRFGFYDEALSDDTAVVIASGEQRVYANLLLVVGVRTE
ncbi:MAG: RbsD/FucU family protein [Planctomycetaceae bacterium]|nr:RbsD/FucU family protein [Planctomycetaceae bacterium]